ncbi:MAG: globin domain-containing protein [Microscillaceae bacterium]|nr:globin domain-containing protein [Microscillaceae bacterium]MDW8460111.1 globin domain-containing protein [Cytophagales bacterium]
MNAAQIKLIKESWVNVVIHVEKAGAVFYNKLFTLYPEIKPLFKNDIVSQDRKLIHAVAVMITKLDKLDDLRKELHSLASRHIYYGVKPEHFRAFKVAFMAMLEEALQKQWSANLKQAWEELFDLIAQAMIEDMKAIAAEQKAQKQEKKIPTNSYATLRK